jgi:plasmid stabilization system protein ParE
MSTFSIIFLPGAEIDVDEIIFWYEQQGTGLSDAFLHDLDYTISRIKRNPEYCFNIGEGIKRATLYRFPFYVIYTIHKKEVRIQTIIHQHRDPEEWQKRINE